MKALLYSLVASVCEDLGRPISLMRLLSAYPEIRVTLEKPSQSISAQSVPHWHELGVYSVQHWQRGDRGVLTGWRATRDGYWESFQLERLEYAQLGQRAITVGWSCDIIDIHGFSGSKSDLTAFSSTDDMVEANSQEMIDAINPEKLAKNLAHREIRIIHSPNTTDHFRRYRWDGRLWLINDGGSHHTAAAKSIAARLRHPVKLTGKLYTYSLNPAAIASLCRDFEMFVISDAPEVVCAFFEAMRAFKATWIWHSMPHPYEKTRAVLLPKGEKRSMRVATELRKAHITDLGEFLRTLAAQQS